MSFRDLLCELTGRGARLGVVTKAAAACGLLLLMSCGGSSSSTSSTTTTTTTNAYAAAYKAITSWAPGVTVSFPSACSMTVSSAGTPPTHSAYYLVPAGAGQTSVTKTPSGVELVVMAYSSFPAATAVSGTFNICPTKAASTTATSGGAIGVITSGEVLFDPYEATIAVALADNASYTFTSNGNTYTASFIDSCNSHSAGGMGGSTWHYHGVPSCWTSTVDGAGPSHIIGIALDGYPVYGGYDINGNVVPASSLDACNGITSPTPEFPGGAYHYVLPVGVTTAQSSLGCYTGTVSATLMAWAQRMRCKMLMSVQLAKGEAPRWTPALPPLPGSVAAKNLAARAAADRMTMAQMGTGGGGGAPGRRPGL